MKKHLSCFLSLFTLACFLPMLSVSADELSSKLKGKILLQVEQNGEAWYVNPANEKRYFMGRPDDAFNLMRELGVGITNKDLNKIAIEFEGLRASDTDLDGLHDFIEDSYGTDKNKKDTDGDGYNDGDEVKNGYNPLGNGQLNIDSSFTQKQIGKILLQVEGSGEAWYVNPSNNKRYYLGRPADAFNVMRNLGLGISNNDLNKINSYETASQTNQTKEDTECSLFADNLNDCTPYTCEFTHPLTEEKMTKKIFGFINGNCVYIEQMPNNSEMECRYSEETRKVVAQYYKDLADSESFGTNINADNDDVKITYTIDGKEVENPLQEILEKGQCIIASSYTETGDCPDGTIYKGDLYTYEGETQITHPICSDPNITCPSCESCSSGYQKKVAQIVDGDAQEVCQECMFNSDCKTGYECNDNDECEIKN